MTQNLGFATNKIGAGNYPEIAISCHSYDLYGEASLQMK